ncbi:MAG: hypothetical protein RIC24_02520 [Hyphomicrobiales bacterium]|jgi:hypothetical protein
MSANTRIGRQELISRLREYLGELSTDSHRTLTRSIDRSRARGEHSPVHEIIMDALREVMDATPGGERSMSAERAFFMPLEPVMGSISLPEKQIGVIDRESLRPIWIWITRDLAPGRCDEALAALRAAIVDEEPEAIAECADDFQREVCKHTEALMSEYDKKQGSLKRLEGQLGSSRVLADLHDIIAFFKQKPALKAFLDRLPEKMPVGRSGLAMLNKALSVYADHPPSNTIYAFAAVLDRLGSPSDLVRFAVFYANSSNPSVIRGTMAGGAVQIALSEAMREIERLRLVLAGDRNLEKVTQSLRLYHELVSAIERTLDEAPEDPWLKRLATVRSRASDLLIKELDPLLHMIKRSVGVMESRGREIVPDASSLQEAVFGLTLFMVAREIRGSLAINSMIKRMEKNIEDALESQGKQAIDRLASASDENWDAAEARSAGAAELFGIYFGGAYGATMVRRHAATVEARARDIDIQAKLAG